MSTYSCVALSLLPSPSATTQHNLQCRKTTLQIIIKSYLTAPKLHGSLRWDHPWCSARTDLLPWFNITVTWGCWHWFAAREEALYADHTTSSVYPMTCQATSTPNQTSTYCVSYRPPSVQADSTVPGETEDILTLSSEWDGTPPTATQDDTKSLNIYATIAELIIWWVE